MAVSEELREQVLAANLALPRHGLVKLTSGNASGVDRKRGVMAIKPSGVRYETLAAGDLVIVDLDGNVISGERRPSTDTPTHLALYRAFEDIGGIVHTHSTWATAWAQAQREIPVLGTTHADLCSHPIPLTRPETCWCKPSPSTGQRSSRVRSCADTRRSPGGRTLPTRSRSRSPSRRWLARRC